MARSPETNEAFFREVDEEVRREKVASAARRYGVSVVALVVLALVAFGGWLLWQNHTASQAGERGEQLTAAMSSLSAGNRDAATKALDPLVKKGDEAYAPLASMLVADMAVQGGKDQDAAAAFLKVSQDAGTPQPLRDLALIRATVLAFDTLTPQQVIDRMKPLALAGKPWFGSAGELTALAQLKLGQKQPAGATLAAVAKDTTVPATTRERVRQLAGDLGVEVDTPVQAGDMGQP